MKKIVSFLLPFLMSITLMIPFNGTNALALNSANNKKENISNLESLSKNKKEIIKDLVHSGLLKNKEGKNVTWKDVQNKVDVIDILSFNDFHGAVLENGKNIGAAKMAREIKRMKEENPNTILATGGDLYQGTAPSNLLKGKPVNAFLKEVGVEISSVGNHEFDWGIDLIPKWEKEGNFEFLASNIYDKATNTPVKWVNPYAIIEKGGKRIAFIGLSTPETKFKTQAKSVENIEFKDPAECANRWADYLRKNKKVDAILAVTHIGSRQDESTKEITGEAVELAKHARGIDAIISAHTHLLVDGVVNGIPIVQGSCSGRALANLSFVFNKQGKLEKIYHSVDELYKRVKELPEDMATRNAVNKCTEDLKPILSKAVCSVSTPLAHDRWEGLSPLGQFMDKYLCKATNSQIGITNGGGFRVALDRKNITVGDMWEVMPFDNTLVTMELKGSDLKRVIENGIKNLEIGWVQYYGLKVYYDDNAEKGKRITSMRLLDGSKVEDNKYYKVATNDFIYGGGDNYDFSGAKNFVDTNIPLRDVIMHKLEKEKGEIPFKFEPSLLAEKDPTVDKEIKDKNDNKEEKDSLSKDSKQEKKESVKENEEQNKKETLVAKEYKTIEDSSNSNSEIKEIPETGSMVGSIGLVGIASLLIVLGAIFIIKEKKRKDKTA